MARTEGPAQRKKHTRLEWALWIGSFAVVGALLYFPLFSSPLPPHDGYIALFLANLLGSLPIVLTGPGQFATFAAGSLYNPILAGLAAGSGALLGDSVGYILGRLGRVTLPASTPAGALSFIERIRTSGSSSRTFWVLFVLALTPNPFFDFVALGCGIAKIGAVRYFIPTALGKLLRFLLWALVGAGFNVSSEMVLAAAPILAVPATAALLAVISWWFLSSATGERQGLLMHFSLFAAVAHLELLTHMAIREHPVVYGLILAGLLAGLGLQVWVYKHQRELTHQRYMEVLRGRAQDGHEDAAEHWASIGLSLTGADFYPRFYRSVWPDHYRDEQKRRFIAVLPDVRFRKSDFTPTELDVPPAIRRNSWAQHLGLCLVMWACHVIYIIYSAATVMSHD